MCSKNSAKKLSKQNSWHLFIMFFSESERESAREKERERQLEKKVFVLSFHSSLIKLLSNT